MSSSKVEFRIGDITFSSEGEETWVASQLEKILDRAPALLELATKNGEDASESIGIYPTSPSDRTTGVSLPSFLQGKNATKSQLEKFLATAEWLTQRGMSRITTTDVTKALKESHQKRLGNPSDCLSKNVMKGFCEKDGNKFFVTQEGRRSLG